MPRPTHLEWPSFYYFRMVVTWIFSEMYPEFYLSQKILAFYLVHIRPEASGYMGAKVSWAHSILKTRYLALEKVYFRANIHSIAYFGL